MGFGEQRRRTGDEQPHVPGAVGHALPGVSVRVTDPET
eukprot:gene38400-51874_t